MRRRLFFILPVAVAVALFSCNLSDFHLDKLSATVDLNPVVYRPFAHGTYLVNDYVTVPGIGSTPVTASQLNFKLISYSLDSLVLNTSGSDSMVVIVKTINETPMKFHYSLSFAGKSMDSGAKLLNAATMNSQGDVIDTHKDSLEFKLDTAAIRKLSTAIKIDLALSLYQPDKGTVLASVLRNSQISFFIGFRAPINLIKTKL